MRDAQIYSAEISGVIDVIITRNIKDYKNSSLGVMTPENYLKLNFCRGVNFPVLQEKV
jgi:hypothetical protein